MAKQKLIWFINEEDRPTETKWIREKVKSDEDAEKSIKDLTGISLDVAKIGDIHRILANIKNKLGEVEFVELLISTLRITMDLNKTKILELAERFEEKKYDKKETDDLFNKYNKMIEMLQQSIQDELETLKFT